MWDASISVLRDYGGRIYNDVCEVQHLVRAPEDDAKQLLRGQFTHDLRHNSGSPAQTVTKAYTNVPEKL